MTFDTTDRMKRIEAAQASADTERLALISDTLEHLGHGRSGTLKALWCRGQESGLPLTQQLTFTGPGGETDLGEELPEPAQQELLALLEARFDTNLDEGEDTFVLSGALPVPGEPRNTALPSPADSADGTPRPPFTVTGARVHDVGNFVYVTPTLTDACGQQFEANDSITMLNWLRPLAPDRQV